MMYEDLVADFAKRTRANLETLRGIQIKNDPKLRVFEVTQLINSMLGLLVFPQQRYVDQIPEIPLAELVSKDGRFRAWWGITPTLKICKSWFGCLEMLFLTFNIEFLSASGGE